MTTGTLYHADGSQEDVLISHGEVALPYHWNKKIPRMPKWDWSMNADSPVLIETDTKRFELTFVTTNGRGLYREVV